MKKKISIGKRREAALMKVAIIMGVNWGLWRHARRIASPKELRYYHEFKSSRVLSGRELKDLGLVDYFLQAANTVL